jgi:hypothetical protein
MHRRAAHSGRRAPTPPALCRGTVRPSFVVTHQDGVETVHAIGRVSPDHKNSCCRSNLNWPVRPARILRLLSINNVGAAAPFERGFGLPLDRAPPEEQSVAQSRACFVACRAGPAPVQAALAPAPTCANSWHDSAIPGPHWATLDSVNANRHAQTREQIRHSHLREDPAVTSLRT